MRATGSRDAEDAAATDAREGWLYGTHRVTTRAISLVSEPEGAKRQGESTSADFEKAGVSFAKALEPNRADVGTVTGMCFRPDLAREDLVLSGSAPMGGVGGWFWERSIVSAQFKRNTDALPCRMPRHRDEPLERKPPLSASEPSYVLYGSHASYATAKSRSYLRKKGIPFVERLPASKRFREYVRPSSENHRIPQLEAPDGTVVQDTTAIFDYLEERFPSPGMLDAANQYLCEFKDVASRPRM